MHQRNMEIDVLKGIGILSVVLGHVWVQDDFPGIYTNMAHNFVYTYHMMIYIYIYIRKSGVCTCRQQWWWQSVCASIRRGYGWA